MNLAIIRFSCAENVIWCPRKIAITVPVPAEEIALWVFFILNISPAYYLYSFNKYIPIAHVVFRFFTKTKTKWNANIYIGVMVRFTVNLGSEIDDCILFLHQNNRRLDVRKRGRRSEVFDHAPSCITPFLYKISSIRIPNWKWKKKQYELINLFLLVNFRIIRSFACFSFAFIVVWGTGTKWKQKQYNHTSK